jgi:hypothetical protein
MNAATSHPNSSARKDMLKRYSRALGLIVAFPGPKGSEYLENLKICLTVTQVEGQPEGSLMASVDWLPGFRLCCGARGRPASNVATPRHAASPTQRAVPRTRA